MRLIGKVTAIFSDGRFNARVERDKGLTEGGGVTVGEFLAYTELFSGVSLGDSVLIDIDVRTIDAPNEELKQIAVEKWEQQGHYIGDLALDNPPAGE